MKLSIVVCTYNRAHAIIPCLDSIAASLARAAPIDAEIVVVDNASTDNTSAIVREWANTSAFPVQLLYEAKKGLAAGQNTGIRAARGDLLAFTDDDCRLSKDYATDLLRHDAEDGDELVFRGGRVELGDPTDLPLTIKTDTTARRWHIKKYPAINYDQGGAFMGANMMMRRAIIDKLGFFDERFGPGASLPAGGDTDYVLRAYIAGIMVEYVPDMVVFHYHGRKTISTGNNLMQNYMIAQGGLYAKYLFRHPDFCRPAYWNVKNAVRETIAGKSYFMPEIGFSCKKKVAYQALGALRYFGCALKKISRGQRA